VKRSLVVTAVADENIDELLLFLAEQDPDVARRFLAALYDDAFPALLRFPQMGTPWISRKPALAEVRWKLLPNLPNHMIFYRSTEKEQVEILWVLHGSRDLPLILDEDD
jgi:plasmid stabilization system protein ParE